MRLVEFWLFFVSYLLSHDVCVVDGHVIAKVFVLLLNGSTSVCTLSSSLLLSPEHAIRWTFG